MKQNRQVLLIVSLFALLSALSACISAQPAAAPTEMQIVDAWARKSQMTMENSMKTTDAMTETTEMTSTMGMGIGGGMGAVYMTIRNPGAADRLIKAESDAAKVTELHTMAEKDGVMSMHPVEAIDVPAGSEAVLKPGGLHVMLIGLTRDLKVGEKVVVKLTFEKAGERVVEAEVRER